MALVGGIAIAIITAAGTWFAAKRATSGDINTSRAEDLWESMRSELTASRAEVVALRAEVVALRNETLGMREEAIHLRTDIAALNSNLAACTEQIRRQKGETP